MKTNNEIFEKLKLKFSRKQLEAFSEIEAEKYRIIAEDLIEEEPKYEIEYWQNKQKELKTNNLNNDTAY